MISALARSRGAFIVASRFKYRRIKDERGEQNLRATANSTRLSLIVHSSRRFCNSPDGMEFPDSGAASTKPAEVSCNGAKVLRSALPSKADLGQASRNWFQFRDMFVEQLETIINIRNPRSGIPLVAAAFCIFFASSGDASLILSSTLASGSPFYAAASAVCNDRRMAIDRGGALRTRSRFLQNQKCR